MKAFVLAEPGKVKWFDAPEPQLVPYGAILKPVAVKMCIRDRILIICRNLLRIFQMKRK